MHMTLKHIYKQCELQRPVRHLGTLSVQVSIRTLSLRVLCRVATD